MFRRFNVIAAISICDIVIFSHEVFSTEKSRLMSASDVNKISVVTFEKKRKVHGHPLTLFIAYLLPLERST